MAMVTITANVANRGNTIIGVSCPPAAPVGVTLGLGVVTANSEAVNNNYAQITKGVTNIIVYCKNCRIWFHG